MLLAVALVAALVLGPLWLQPNGLIYPPQGEYSDLTITFWPNILFNIQAVRQNGQFPLWRPWIMSGSPYWGNPQSGLFYPPNVAFFLLPIALGFSLLAWLHLVWTGWGMYRLQRQGFALSPWASFLSAMTWMLAPKGFAHLGAGHLGIVYAVAWWPWVITEGLLAWRRRSPVRAALSAAALAMQGLTHPQIAMLTAGTLTIALLYLAWMEHDITSWRTWLVFWPWLPVLCLLTVPVWWPLFRLLPYLTRAGATAVYALSPARALLGLFWGQRASPHEATVYLGLLPLWLAPLAWRKDQRKRAWLALLLALLGVGLSAAGGKIPWLAPLMRVPARAWFMVALSGALLTGWGAEALLEPMSVRERQRWTRGILALALAGMLFGIGTALIARSLRSAGVGLAAFALLDAAWLLSLLFRRVPVRLAQMVGASLLVADLVAVDLTLWRPLSVEAAFSSGDEVAGLLADKTEAQHDPAPARVYSPSYSVPQHLGAQYGLRQVDGVDPIQLAHYRRFMALAGGYADPIYTVTIPAFPEGEDVRFALRGSQPRADLLGLLACRYVVAAFPLEAEGLRLWQRVGGHWIYENERLLPRAWVTRWVEAVPDLDSALARLETGFVVAGGAVVEGGKALNGAPGYQPAFITGYTPNRVQIEADAQGPSLLVVSEVWSPGWRVWVDDQEVLMYRVDGVVRGIYLDGGHHQVMMRAEW